MPRKVAIFSGRFQPFHAGHYETYQHLVDRFGKDNVFIATSNKQDPEESPFSFDEKHEIITSMFPIPGDKVVQVKSPYRPVEITEKLPPDTIVITPVSEKDRERAEKRLAGKYYKSFDDTPPEQLNRFELNGYYTIVPNPTFKIDGKMVSGTEVRNALRSSRSAESKVDLFKQMYGKFNPNIFKRMVKKLRATDPSRSRPEPPQNVEDPQRGSKTPEDPQGAQGPGIDPNAKVRNPLTKRDILVKTALRYPQDHPAYKAARQMFKSGKLGEIFDAVMVEEELIKSFNERVNAAMLGDVRNEILIKPTDSRGDVVMKLKKARGHGIYHYPLTHALHINRLPSDDVPDGMHKKQEKEAETEKGPDQLNDVLEEEKSSTERVRRYYKRHPEKVKKYLRKTAKDRAARNRDRRKAERTHGKDAMKDKDVHHPDGPHGGKTQIVGKDHGPDKKNEMVNEGGAFGHMAHPYEDTDLTFGDYKDIIAKALTGDLGDEEPVTEKTDGQNIAFTVKDGKVRFARNKGQLKNYGQNSLDVNGIADMFKDRGELTTAFVGAAEDLQAAVAKLDPETVKETFREGENFMSAEVIYPGTRNVVPYDKSILVLHGTIQYDKDGNALDFTRDTGKALAEKIIEVGAERQKMFGIQAAKVMVFNDADREKFIEARDRLQSQVDHIAAQYSLDDDSKIAEYYARWWSDKLTQKAQEHGLKLAPDVKKALIRRFAFGDKSLRLNKIPDQEVRNWVSAYEKGDYKADKKLSERAFEMIFLHTGALSLQRVEDFMTSNVPAGSEQLKREIVQSLIAVKDEATDDQAEKMYYELERLQQLGIDKIVPSEGLIFVHGGNLYKLPGTFSPINQLLGTMKYGNRGAPPKSSEKSKEEPKGKKGFINQFYDHKILNPETGRQITIQSALTYDPEHPARKQALAYLSARL